MQSLRDQIRSILREELAQLKASSLGVTTETVRISSSEDLTRFAQSILERSAEPGFTEKVRSGEIRFGLQEDVTPRPSYSTNAAAAIVSSPARAAAPILDKKLITEADISKISSGGVTIAKSARVTPLALDEARRKGIRIERIET